VTGLIDRALARDIGLVRATSALRMTVCVCAGMLVGWLIAGAAGLPGTVGLMIGAVPAFLACFVVNDTSTARTAARTALLVVPFVVALSASLELHEHRTAELLLVVVLLFAQLYAPRFGVWAGDVGAGLFTAYLCGLLLPLPATSLEALIAIGAASLAVTALARAVFFRPNPYRALLRARRAFLASGRSVLEAAAEVLADPGTRSRRRLVLRGRRFHEAALVADGLLAEPTGGRRITVADELHERLFDTELTVSAISRTVLELCAPDVPAAVRDAARRAVDSVARHGGGAGHAVAQHFLQTVEAGALVPAGRADVLAHVHTLALALSDTTTGAQAWHRLRQDLPRSGEDVPFRSAVTLVGGRPAGSNPVLLAALDAGLDGRRRRISAPLRTAVQGLVAVAVVEPVGLLVGGSRFYWGVIGVLVVLAGTNSTHERLRKSAHRIVGTVVGGAIGIVLAAVLGQDHPWWTLVVVVVALAVGVHGFTANYSTWVAALVVLLCQVYAATGQFGVDLVVLRLAENGLGALVATLVAAVVLPVGTRAMVRQAVGRHLDAVRSLVLEIAERPLERPTRAARAVDVTGWQVDAVLRPLVARPTAAPERALLATVTRSARHLALTTGSAAEAEAVREAATTLAGSLEDLHAAMASVVPGGPADWVRTVPPPPTAGDRLHQLDRLDAAAAVLAAAHGMRVPGAPGERTDPRSAARTALAVRRRFDHNHLTAHAPR
jgi:hypothetical protein